MGVDARPEGPLASLGHLTKGELCREQALVFRCSRPSDTQTGKFPLNQTLLEHVGWLPVRNEFGPTVREMSHEFPLIVGEWCLESMSAKAAAMPQSERLGFYRSLADAQLAAWDGTVGWFFWSYKLLVDGSNLDGWDLRKSIALGLGSRRGLRTHLRCHRRRGRSRRYPPFAQSNHPSRLFGHPLRSLRHMVPARSTRHWP